MLFWDVTRINLDLNGWLKVIRALKGIRLVVFIVHTTVSGPHLEEEGLTWVSEARMKSNKPVSICKEGNFSVEYPMHCIADDAPKVGPPQHVEEEGQHAQAGGRDDEKEQHEQQE